MTPASASVSASVSVSASAAASVDSNISETVAGIETSPADSISINDPVYQVP